MLGGGGRLEEEHPEGVLVHVEGVFITRNASHQQPWTVLQLKEKKKKEEKKETNNSSWPPLMRAGQMMSYVTFS